MLAAGANVTAYLFFGEEYATGHTMSLVHSSNTTGTVFDNFEPERLKKGFLNIRIFDEQLNNPIQYTVEY
jgi:hypothetical protein